MVALLTCHTSAEVTYLTMLLHTLTRRPLRLRHTLQLTRRQWEAHMLMPEAHMFMLQAHMLMLQAHIPILTLNKGLHAY
jgi:hypothetical protein